MALDLIGALGHERLEASERKETRPLWQLLVCFTYVMQNEVSSTDSNLIKTALASFLAFMQSDPAIDAGRQCKARIEMILRGV